MDSGSRRKTIPSLSAEELMTLRQCSREGALYRAMPVGLICSGAAYALMTRSGSRLVGVKAFLVGIGTYGIAKTTYIPTCMDRVRHLPGERSPAAQVMLGQRKLEDVMAELGDGPAVVMTPEEIDERNRAVVESPGYPEQVQVKDKAVSHEDLRALNRSQHALGQAPALRRPPPPRPSDADVPPMRAPPQPPKNTTSFGDEGFS